MSSKNIRVVEIQKCVQNAFSYLKNNFRTIDNKRGWHQFLGTDKVGVVATAQALLCFRYFQEDYSKLNLALSTLKETQLHNRNDLRRTGGWAYVTSASDFPTTECTSWALLGLKTARNDATESISAGINWLLSNHPSEGNTDIGWGCTKTDKPRVYSTSLAIQTLVNCGHSSSNQLSRAKSWLIAARNNLDGGWGETEGGPSTYVHTAHAIIALIDSGVSPDLETIAKACDWLLDNFNSTTLWNDLDKGGLLEYIDIKNPISNDTKTHRVTYFHFTIPWVTTALIKCGRVNSIQVFEAIKWILENGRNGYWDHPYLRAKKNKPMWAIHDCLLALSTLKSEFSSNWPNIERIVFKKGEIIIKPIKPSENHIFFQKLYHSKIARSCFGVSGVGFLLVLLDVISFEIGLWVIIVPFIINIIANLVTQKNI